MRPEGTVKVKSLEEVTGLHSPHASHSPFRGRMSQAGQGQTGLGSTREGTQRSKERREGKNSRLRGAIGNSGNGKPVGGGRAQSNLKKNQ